MGNLWLVLLLTICLAEDVHGFCYFRGGIVPTDCKEFEYCCGLGKHRRCCRSGELDRSAMITGLCVGIIFGVILIVLAVSGCCKLWKRRN